MKNQTKDLINRLVDDKCPSCKGRCTDCYMPILIGDIMHKIVTEMETGKRGWPFGELIALWQHCGFTRSLQEIFEEAEWGGLDCHFANETPCEHCPQLPKQGPIRNLFQFLISLEL